MPCILYDYVNSEGTNEFKEWSKKIQKAQLGKLNKKLDSLALNGPDLYPGLLTGTPKPGISKIRVRGSVELRPLLCHGPVDVKGEITLLFGAKEVQWEFVPANALDVADANKNEVIKDPNNRRIEHERVGGSTKK